MYMAKALTKTTNIHPVGDRVLVEIPPREEKTKSGIIIPDTVGQEKPEQGIVIAVGGGRVSENGEIIPMDVKVGDRIVFSKYGYDEITVDDKKYYIVRGENILAIVE